MRGTKRTRALFVAALATVLFVMASATGISGAQAHDDHGDHDAHENPTTTMPPSSSTTSPPQPGSQTTAIRYGPFNVQGAPMNPDGTHGHAHTGNRFVLHPQALQQLPSPA
jgi:hypothetical protein